ncbi:helix-turn-helix domain-containing protein [Amycolatopsis saalfeldensis]|uniref:Helix-turn-helix domain-containing protein n=1 Tax=Amycolatopsis saalfeldensis TaxID=394193 RepID=A0A1H8YN16_9PSEU|nr:helix-turn-helix transcriptional regulator [Amycolatopsis saalfeldensis]SEP53585.1 Helix-turn-helix domain-containing protein [Amycolatopsis saalfeldensis]
MPSTTHRGVVAALMNQHHTPGEIVRIARTAAGWNQAELARRCGYSRSQISRWETGSSPLRDVETLRALARVLFLPVEVFGLALDHSTGVSTRPAAPPEHKVSGDPMPVWEEQDPMRRRTLLAGMGALAGSAVLGTPANGAAAAAADPISALEKALLAPPLTTGAPAEVAQLRHAVAVARSVFAYGRYGEVAARMPGLIVAATATRADPRAGDTATAAHAQLAELYTLTTDLAIKTGHDRLAWTAADRASQAADASGDLLTQATARRVWAIVLRRAGHGDTAQQMVIDTAHALQPDLRGPEQLSVFGSLMETAAYTAAADGDRDTARTFIAEAVDAATRLGTDGNHRYTSFGPTGVGLYQLSIARVMGDSGAAIEHARRINPASIPSTERRARYWVDVARAYHQWDKPEHCYRALLAAEQASPDEVRYRKPTAAMTTTLLRHPTANRLPGLRDFARRTGTSV